MPRYSSKAIGVQKACADWLCGLPGLLENVVRVDEEMWKKQKAAEMHFARYRLCGHCDRCVGVWDWLMDGTEEG
jgi:hypothetical protein